MLIIISPATTMEPDAPCAVAQPTQPLFRAEAARLVRLLRPLSPAEMAALMNLSDELAQLNVARYARWTEVHTAENGRAALCAFRGDVYRALDVDTLPARSLDWAQGHLRILSGLYGALRPFDLVQPYRLEMKTPLCGPGWENLRDFWREPVRSALNEALAASGSDLLVNLASNEYAGVVGKRGVNGRWLDVQFKEEKGGNFRTIGYYAKRARGLMARHLLRAGTTDPAALRAFAGEGYAFNPELSQEGKWVFTRASPSMK